MGYWSKWKDRKPVAKDYEKWFWQHVSPEPLSGCWLWTGGMAGNYGVINLCRQDKPIKAHRFSFQLHERSLEKHELVRHLCHNPSCVNPKHLAAGTQADNVRDDSLIGKRYRKIDEATALLVFADRDAGMTERALGDKYKVSHSTIHNMLSGQSHKVPKEKYDQTKLSEK